MKNLSKKSILSAAIPLMFLSACIPGSDDANREESSSSSSSSQVSSEAQSSSSARPTANVTYFGTVKPAGISIYQEGTHRLLLEDGKFIFLESDNVDLNGYVNEEVSAFGSVRPTVEEGGMIMAVSKMSLKEPKEESMTGSAKDLNDTNVPEEESSSSSQAESDDSVSEGSSSSAESAESSSSQSSSQSSDSSSSSSSQETESEFEVTVSEKLSEKIDAMSAEDISEGRWSQSYCTSHIGFCIPVHKNWWFKSFGNTSTNLWHVEISNSEIESIGDGPILVRLTSGDIPEGSAADGDVVSRGNQVVGYRSWTEGRHFEIIADAKLQGAVAYLTQGLNASVDR